MEKNPVDELSGATRKRPREYEEYDELGNKEEQLSRCMKCNRELGDEWLTKINERNKKEAKCMMCDTEDLVADMEKSDFASRKGNRERVCVYTLIEVSKRRRYAAAVTEEAVREARAKTEEVCRVYNKIAQAQMETDKMDAYLQAKQVQLVAMQEAKRLYDAAEPDEREEQSSEEGEREGDEEQRLAKKRKWQMQEHDDEGQMP